MSWASEYNKLKKKREEEEAEEQAQGDIAPVKESISGRGFSPTNSIVRFGNTDAHKAWLGGAADRLAQQRFTSKFLENGGQTNSRGERYWKDDRGNTFWEDGTAVSREGISFFVDAQGRHVTEDGYLLDENGRMTDKKVDSVPSIPGADEIGAPTLPQGATQNQVSSHAMSGNNNNAWFKNPFDDNGWQFSDVPKAILGTIGDVGVNVIEGFSRGIEGVIDLGFYAGAMGQKWRSTIFLAIIFFSGFG